MWQASEQICVHVETGGLRTTLCRIDGMLSCIVVSPSSYPRHFCGAQCLKKGSQADWTPKSVIRTPRRSCAQLAWSYNFGHTQQRRPVYKQIT